MSDNLWTHAYDDLYKAISMKGGKDELDADELLKIAEIKALLAIGQEVSALNPRNVAFTDKDGVPRNGWGLATHE